MFLKTQRASLSTFNNDNLTRLRTQEKKERGSCTSLGGRIDSHMRACQCVDVCVYVQYVYVCILVHVGVYVRKGVSVHSYMRA